MSRTKRFSANLVSKQPFTCLLLCILCTVGAYSQEKEKSDTTKRSIRNNRLTREIVESITHIPPTDTIFTVKAEDAFLPYEGKIVRKIWIVDMGFERSFYSGTNRSKKTIVKVSNALHSDTKQRIIHDNLFIKENRPLNPYKVADNERYLRDLEFILDTHIEVAPVYDTDSVDLIITTRDVFSLGGSLSPRSPTDYRFEVYDANLLGWGQRLQLNGMVNNDRTPVFGSEVIYTKNSVAGTLTNMSLGYTNINTGSSYGDENEEAFFMRLSRPLVSPYTRMAGGLEVSHNRSGNINSKPDSLFLGYTYNVYDAWLGYNIGVHNAFRNRSRHFLSLRYFNQDFKTVPLQVKEQMNPRYNDNYFLLSQFTFFRQNFYKTRYIYGFGRTEDIPYGHVAYFTAGWSRQLHLKRPYIDAGLEKKVVNRSGDFYEVDLRLATFLQDNKPQDATALLAMSWFSRLMKFNQFKIRQYLRGSYTAEVNRVTSQLLNINNDFGVRGFSTDSLRGERRLGFTTETVFFTNWKLLGFRFAPLTFLDMALLSKPGKSVFYDKPYFGIGAGIRTRNENLIFGTIQLKVTFFPRTIEDLAMFKVNVTTNLRLKYTASFVRTPGFVQPNQAY